MDESAGKQSVRVRVFVDFWNFQLSVNALEEDLKIDWSVLGRCLATEAGCVVDPDAHVVYQGMNVYGSYGSGDRDAALRKWAEYTLARFPGVQVEMTRRRKRLRGFGCPSCHSKLTACPTCGADMRGTEEKGIDTRIATAMISLAWIDNYDVAVLMSSDRDFIPVVEFLETKGVKVVHGAFPPRGSDLAQKCWGSIAVPDIRNQIRR